MALSSKYLAIGITVLAVSGSLASLALPVPTGHDQLSVQVQLVITLFVFLSFTGSSILFISGLSGFTARLKHAYALVCLGLGLLGLAFVQLPAVVYFGNAEVFWKHTGGAALIFVGSLFVLFFGLRAFAKLFNVKNLTTSFWFAITASIIGGLIFSFLPHVPTATPELEFDVANAFTVISTVFTFLMLLQIIQIKRVAGLAYTNALAWFQLAFIAIALGAPSYLVAVLIFGDQQWFVVGVIPIVPLIIAGFLLVRAAYAFNRITVENPGLERTVARSFFGRPLNTKAQERVSSIDIVIYTANLASNPQAINPILDRLRRVTAGLAGGQSLSSSDEESLMGVYLDIERYLTESDPIRKFNKVALRQLIADGLHLTSSTQGTFWTKLN